MNTDTQETPVSPEVGSRKWAHQWGVDDAMDTGTFFPEQVGAWLRSDYTEGFLSMQPYNESAKLWMDAFLRRQDAEEAYMNWRRLDSEKVRA